MLYKKLYFHISKIFGKYNTIIFIYENNFAGFAYPKCEIEPLFEFDDEAINPGLEFIDEEVNDLLNNVKLLVSRYNDLFATNSFWVSQQLSSIRL